MDGDKQNNGFMDMIKNGLSYTAKIILENISPPIQESMEKVMQNFEDRIMLIEERMIKKLFLYMIIGFGVIFLIFALFFYMIEILNWSNSVACFFISIIMFFTGLLLKLGETNGVKK